MSRLLDVSVTEKIITDNALQNDDKLLIGEDKRMCDVCKAQPAAEKILRTNGFIKINQFLCNGCIRTLKLNEVAVQLQNTPLPNTTTAGGSISSSSTPPFTSGSLRSTITSPRASSNPTSLSVSTPSSPVTLGASGSKLDKRRNAAAQPPLNKSSSTISVLFVFCYVEICYFFFLNRFFFSLVVKNKIEWKQQ